MVMTKEELNKQRKEYYEKNKEKILLQKKEYHQKNKEKIKIKDKEYYEKNKEKIAKQKREYREKNKEKIKEYSQSEKGKICRTIAQWKLAGLICESRDEYEYIYDRWLFSERCEEPKCNKEYTKDNIKNMDHCHLTGLFRNILCHSCNTKRRTKENTSGIPNIVKSKRNGWEYKILIKGKRHTKYSKDLELLKQYKIDFEKENLYNI